MTNEEAIKTLDAMWKMLTSAYDDIADSHVVAYTMAVDALKEQMDLQSTCNNLATDTISRQAAIDALCGECQGRCIPCEAYPCSEVRALENVPSAQPEPHYDEWCTDCKEYDHERHCCPRWNKVIKQTVEDLKGVDDRKWIPCVDGNEPKANAECWISTNAKYVRRAIYAPRANNQPNGFIVTVGSFGFYEYGKSAKAWMPYTQEPEPYKEGEQNESD